MPSVRACAFSQLRADLFQADADLPSTTHMLRTLKLQVLQAARAAGVNSALARTEWRRNKLLILCYHGISQDDEHEWNPQLFMSPQAFERRLQILQDGGYSVLSLAEAVEKLADRSLPSKSVVLTFDDGMVNFRTRALPLLRKHGYPATVYLRTDYCYYRSPIFYLACPYMLWKQRHSNFPPNANLGWLEPQDLRTAEGLSRAWSRIRSIDEERNLSYQDRDPLLAELARHIGLDYSAFLESRIMQIMSPDEVSAVAREGTDVQLHTHRHQKVSRLGGQGRLQTAIEENRKRIVELTGRNTVHFCYPSGDYRPEALPVLRELGIATATTCDPGLADRSSDLLLLPRYIDTSLQTEAEFEGWLSGASSFLTNHRPPATPQAIEYKLAGAAPDTG